MATWVVSLIVLSIFLFGLKKLYKSFSTGSCSSCSSSSCSSGGCSCGSSNVSSNSSEELCNCKSTTKSACQCSSK